MMVSLFDTDSLLVIDVGSVSTRAVLFDVVDGQYRYLGSGEAPTTLDAPYKNISEGVRQAIDQLQRITGRVLIGPDEELIMPSSSNGSGVDRFAATMSAGEPINVVAVGLLEDVSLESARRLAMTTYSKVLQVISLNDRRRVDARINTIVRLRPDPILVAGGTQDGASQSVLNLLEPVGLACYLLPPAHRPEVLFAGNKGLRDEVRSSLADVTTLHFAPNIRPALEVEQLDAAQLQIAKTFARLRARKIMGVDELNSWAGGDMLPTATTFGRIIRILSKVLSEKKGVLGLDVGASATVLSTAVSGDMALGVFPQFGLGTGLSELLNYIQLTDILRWLGEEISPEDVRGYLLNKSLYPASLPVTTEEMAIEHAITRQIIQSAVKFSAKGFPEKARTSGTGLLPLVDPILATGSVLTKAPSLAHSALMILDGLQPVGVSSLILDQNHIASALGAAAAVNPLLAVQVLNSSSFLHLGTVITPVGRARAGTPVLRVTMQHQGGHENNLEIKYGMLEVLPLPYGQRASIKLQPLHRFDVGMGVPGRGGRIEDVTGGLLGVIIDARGRPLVLPGDRGKNQELIRKWLSTLGGLS
jgi:hypothetical protein